MDEWLSEIELNEADNGPSDEEVKQNMRHAEENHKQHMRHAEELHHQHKKHHDEAHSQNMGIARAGGYFYSPPPCRQPAPPVAPAAPAPAPSDAPTGP